MKIDKLVTLKYMLLFGIVLQFAAFSQSLTLRKQVATPGTFRTDIWGYVDDATGNEYAIAGDQSGSGITIIDVTDPDNAAITGAETTVHGFDVKVWNHYVYTVNGGYSGLGDIIDISDPANPNVVGSFPTSHNIFISDNGFLIDDRLNIYDLNNTPEAPVLVNTGANAGHDIAVIDGRLYDFHGGDGTRIFDFSDPANLQLLGAINDPSINYHHSGWVSADRNTLFICDELANHPTADISVWDISDLENPERIDDFADPSAIVHNLYVIGNYAVVAYYTAGLRVYDISNPADISIVAEYDTSPLNGEFFGGAFGVYAFFPSGTIVLNDWQQGVFVFTFDSTTTGTGPQPGVPAAFRLAQNYPNPFNPATTIVFDLPKESTVNLIIYNVMGQKIRSLYSGATVAGTHAVDWDGRDDSGNPVTSGSYFYRLETDGFSETRRMLLVR